MNVHIWDALNTILFLILCFIKCSCQCFSVGQKLCDFESLFETWGFLLLHIYTPIQHVILRIFTLQWCHTTRLLSLLHYTYLTAIITRFEMQRKHMISFSNMIICLSVSAGLLFVMEETFKSCYCFRYFCQVFSLFISVRKLWHMIQVLTHKWHLINSLSLPNSIHPGYASSQGKASHSECWQEFRLN